MLQYRVYLYSRSVHAEMLLNDGSRSTNSGSAKAAASSRPSTFEFHSHNPTVPCRYSARSLIVYLHHPLTSPLTKMVPLPYKTTELCRCRTSDSKAFFDIHVCCVLGASDLLAEVSFARSEISFATDIWCLQQLFVMIYRAQSHWFE